MVAMLGRCMAKGRCAASIRPFMSNTMHVLACSHESARSLAPRVPVQIRTKFTWPSLKRPNVKRYPPDFAVPHVNGMVKKEDILKQEWVQKMFPDGNTPPEWNDLEVKDFDKVRVRKKPFNRRPPPVYGDEFKGYSPKKEYIVNRFKEAFSNDVVLAVDSLEMKSKDWSIFRDRVFLATKFKILKTKNSLVRRSLQKTRFEVFGPLITGGVKLWYTDDIANLKGLLKFLKKEPTHMVLGGKVLNQIFNHTQLPAVAAMPSLETTRGELVSILGEPAQRVARNIGHHPSMLGQLLDTHANPPPSDDDAESKDSTN